MNASHPGPGHVPGRAAVLGAGPIGCATAGYLALQGMEVSIFDLSPEAVSAISASGIIRLEGVIQGQAPIRAATTDIARVLEGARLVISAVPASAHKALARALAPFIQDGALLLIQPGQTLSAVTFLHTAMHHGMRAGITAVETLNTLFTGRLASPGRVQVYAVKNSVWYAALPASRTAAAGALLERLFPSLSPLPSILQVSLHNFNAILHPPITLLNAGSIDGGEDFLFYVQGGTPHIMQVVEDLDGERMEILRALGIPGFPLTQWFHEAYGVQESDYHAAVAATAPYATIKGPRSLQTRLLLEDIPTGLVPYCSIARALGVPVPTMNATVRLCSSLYRRDFFATGRTLRALDLGGLDGPALLQKLGPDSTELPWA